MGEIGLQRRDQKIVQVVIFFLAEIAFVSYRPMEQR